jgi:hypothetical protein
LRFIERTSSTGRDEGAGITPLPTIMPPPPCGRDGYVGGGIVWDSTAAEKYEECLNKAKIILDPPSPRPFQLLETLLWTPEEGYFLSSRHLERLRESALYFDYPYDEALIRKALDEKAEALPSGPCRLRLLLSRNGDVECSSVLIGLPDVRLLRVRLARQAVHSRDPFLYHKTTRRDLYEKAQASLMQTTFFSIMKRKRSRNPASPTWWSSVKAGWSHHRFAAVFSTGLTVRSCWTAGRYLKK